MSGSTERKVHVNNNPVNTERMTKPVVVCKLYGNKINTNRFKYGIGILASVMLTVTWFKQSKTSDRHERSLKKKRIIK